MCYWSTQFGAYMYVHIHVFYIHVMAKYMYPNMSALQSKAEGVDPEKAKKAQERIQ